jgi:hypothetical protein
MKTILKFFGATCAVLAAVFLLSGAAIDDAGRLFVSTGATNNAHVTGYASMTMSTGFVVSAATIGPNKFTNFSYAVQSGNVSTISNTWIVVTNAGNYRLSFGSGLAGQNNSKIALQLWTNGPGITPAQCSVIQYECFMNAVGDFETGFKMTTVFLPAGTHVFLQTTNSLAVVQTNRNTCFSVGAVN